MTHTTYTAELSDGWDFVIDGNGNLSMLRGTAATVQNVCNECRLFQHDAVFRYEDGIAWFEDQIALPVQRAVTTGDLREAAASVPGVLTVDSVTLTAFDPATRTLSAEIQISTEDGNNGTARI